MTENENYEQMVENPALKDLLFQCSTIPVVYHTRCSEFCSSIPQRAQHRERGGLGASLAFQMKDRMIFLLLGCLNGQLVIFNHWMQSKCLQISPGLATLLLCECNSMWKVVGE